MRRGITFLKFDQRVGRETSGLLSSSYGGLGPFAPKGDFAGRTNGRTDERTTGLRELDVS